MLSGQSDWDMHLTSELAFYGGNRVCIHIWYWYIIRKNIEAIKRLQRRDCPLRRL